MKKFSLRSVSDILSDEQMKRQTGGKEGCWAIHCSDGIYYAANCYDACGGTSPCYPCP